MIDAAILSICLSATNINTEACKSGLYAGSVQLGLSQSFEFIENKALEYTKNKIQKIIGEKSTTVIGYGLFIYKTIDNKRLKFQLPNFNICDKLENEITDTGYTLNFTWYLK